MTRDEVVAMAARHSYGSRPRRGETLAEWVTREQCFPIAWTELVAEEPRPNAAVLIDGSVLSLPVPIYLPR